MENVVNISDYIIFRLKSEGDNFLNFLKLQKLLYYTQAWNLALKKDRLFDSDFQAWIHGPVNRQVFDIYKDEKYLYSEINLDDIQSDEFKNLPEEVKFHVDQVLDVYAGFSSTELERMTHEEEPWIKARNGYSDFQRCEETIDNNIMRDYYAARIK